MNPWYSIKNVVELILNEVNVVDWINRIAFDQSLARIEPCMRVIIGGSRGNWCSKEIFISDGRKEEKVQPHMLTSGYV